MKTDDNTDNTEVEPPSGASGSGVGIGEIGGIGVFAAGAAYALGYSAQSGFYNAFGLTPEQVGVDKISALLRITPLAALFGVVTPVAVAVVLAAGRWIQREVFDLLPGKWFKRYPMLIVWPAILLVPALYMASNAREMYAGPTGLVGNYRIWDVFFVAVLLWLVVAAMWYVFDRILGSRFATLGVSVAVVAIGCLAVSQFVSVPAQVLRDRPYPGASVRLWLIGIQPSFAEVQWRKQQDAPQYLARNPERIFVVLGQTADRYTLYEYCERKVYSVDTADAHVVRVLPPQQTGEAQDVWMRQAFPC